jgi:hypothetical protein
MTLPQFCLAYVESRVVWAGFKPPLPPRNARFSLARVLVFTLGQALGGAIIGWAIAVLLGLVIFHSGPFVLFNAPFSWLIWLLAAFSACQGILGYGFTALCWNQRAAKLLANPSLDVGLKPARYPFFRSLLGLGYFVICALVAPAALLLTFENVRGEILWRMERNKLIAQGERLQFRDILGPAIPPEQNAGAAPIFAPFFDYIPRSSWSAERKRQGGGTEWRGSNALYRIEERIKVPDNFIPSKPKEAATTPAVDLALLADAYRKIAASTDKDTPSWAAELKLPAGTNDPARTVLAGLSVADKELAEFCAAAALPRSQFPIHYEEGFDSLLRHLANMKAVNVALQRRCAARLAIGNTNAAFEDAQCALRVADLLREEPLLISQLVRYAQNSIAINTVWQGLADHRWTDTQLAAFQEEFAQLDFLSGITLAFEGERACGIQAIDGWVAGPKNLSDMVGPTESGSPAQFPARFFSRGMLRQNEIALADYHTRQIHAIQLACSNAPQTGLATLAKTFADAAVTEEQAVMKSPSPYRVLIAMLAPATGHALKRTAKSQTVARLAMVACALERYHLKQNVYPEKLDDLVPAFLPAPPLDPMNNQPFHYHRTDDGWFQLYSVGLNGQDDGGVFMVKKSGNKQEELDWPWPVPSRPERYRVF